MSYFCPECKNEVRKVPDEFVNYECKACNKKWTIVDLDNMPRELLDKMVRDDHLMAKIKELGPALERSSI